MTEQDIDILLQYLRKVAVPANDQAAFLKAFERFQALRYRQKQVA